MTRNGLIATCFVCLLIAGTGRAHGLDPSKRLTQYHHNVWRVQDGFFTGALSSVSQTDDGYLWVDTWNHFRPEMESRLNHQVRMLAPGHAAAACPGCEAARWLPSDREEIRPARRSAALRRPSQ